MIRLFYTFLFLFSSLFVVGQVPDYFDDDPVWSYKGRSVALGCGINFQDNLYINGDSLWNDSIYYKKLYRLRVYTEYDIDTTDENSCENVYTTNIYYLMVRQEDRKIYFRDSYSEKLAYDFNREVGDTINDTWFTSFNIYPTIVTAVDSVLVNNEYLRKNYIESEQGDSIKPEFLLEGIGHDWGFISSYFSNYWDNYQLCYGSFDTAYYVFEGQELECDLLEPVQVSINESWADSGALWHYSYFNMIGEGYSEISYQGDTTLLGIEAKKLALSNHYFNQINGQYEDDYRGFEFTYSDEDHVYHFINEEFKVLYDFSAQIGDTLTHYLYSDLLFEECDSLGRSIVSETGTELINGEELRWYELVHLDGIAMLPGKIMEKIGSHGYMFPYINGCIATEEASDPLRCYEDDNFELYVNPDYEGECEFIYEFNYPVYFDHDPKWRLDRTMSEFISGNGCFVTAETVYYLNGDSVINDIEYKVLNMRGVASEFSVGEPDPWDPPCNQTNTFDQFVSLVRQEERKVYQKVEWNDEDLLLYDFELSIGDTIQGTELSQYFNQDVVVTDIDSIWFNNEYLRLIYYEGGGETDYFLEGVGHALGFLEAPDIGLDFASTLYCYSQDDFYIYTFEGGEWACDFSVSIEEEIGDKSEFTLFPNPADHVINIEFQTVINTLNISIYSTSGQLIINTEYINSNKIAIDVSDLNSGMYFIEIIGDNHFRTVKPFVVN